MTLDMSNHEAETLAVAGMLRHPDAYWAINAVGLTAGDFLSTQNRKVMRAVEAVVADKNQPDLVLVVEELMGGADDPSYAERLMGTPCSVPQATEAARMVKGLSTSRKLISVGAYIIEVAQEKRADSEEAVSLAESELRKVRDELPAPDRSPDPADILRRVRTGGQEPGIPIRFVPALYEMSGGFLPGHLWVIGGFSSTGKSAVACNIIADCIAERRWVGLISTEMTQENYMQRLLSLLSGVPFRDVRDRAFFGDQIEAIGRAERELRPATVRIFDDVYRISDIRLQATKMRETTGLDVLLVDFMQNVRASKGDFSFSDMTEITLDLQQLAKDLRVTVIAFSQVSNEMAKWDSQGGDDNYYGFKGSGAIKDAAD
ncbi:MAG TPA: DnaB-like helicase C-terminal domain-containing protein, partial [Gemmatimonadales bacterium]|nr:DnaB-like helicase C-terminal domain-containing protein [Gemmatimonadales bacterium]